MRAGGPRKDSADNTQFGVHYGIVCQNNDPDGLGRIKIRLPWLDGGDTDQMHWAQLATPMAGDKFGWYTLPDVNDVVVVAFVAGDVTQPVILGGVWSKPDSSPEPNDDGKNNFRGYRSRSGHRLILDDSSKAKVVFVDKTGNNMIGIGELASDGSGPNICAVHKPPMSGDTGVAFSSMEGTLEITCTKGKLTVEAKQDIKINAKEDLAIKAGSDLKMEGSSTTKVTSGSPSDYDSSPINIA
jgi:uncharacterized protein involved in type VI secretion and phage assembly